MFSSEIRRALGAIKVWESGDIIHIEGLPANVVMRDIQAHWATSKIGGYIFNTVARSSVSFFRFFAADVVYALETLCAERTSLHNVRALRSVIKEMYANTWLKDTRIEHPDILDFTRLKELNVSLFPHQLEFLQTYNSNVPKYKLNGYLLGAAAGTGKTIISLALGAVLNADVVICIVPKNAVDRVWVDTVRTRFTKVTSCWASTGSAPLEKGYQYYIFHYEQLANAIAFFKTNHFKKPLVILDESHNFNELDAQRTQLFISLCSTLQAKHVVWASGTPIKAIGNEVMPLLRTLDPYFTDPVEERFKKIFGKSASKATDILRNRLGLITFKVDKSTVVTGSVVTAEKRIQMPNGSSYTLDAIKTVMVAFIKQQMAFYRTNMPSFTQRYEYCLDLHLKTLQTPAQRELFLQYRADVALIRKSYDPILMKQLVQSCNQYELRIIVPSLPSALKEEFKGLRSIIKYFQLKVQGEALGRILGRLRTQCHIDMVKHSGIEIEIETSIKKTVVFSSYVEVVDETDRYLRERGFTPLRVYGDTNKDLVSIIDRFDKDPDANPLIATFQSLSTAVPLIMANTVILMNSPFRAHEYLQSTSRVNRLGQDTEVQIVNVLLDTGELPNISTRSAEIMQWSAEQVDALLGIKTSADSEVLALEEFIDYIEGTAYSAPAYLSWR